MFLKMSVLKKMMKKAYKGGCLIIGDAPVVEEDEITMDGYVISSGWWSFWIDKDYIPKELKGAIIELCGELPFDGHYFKASESLGNQEMLPFAAEVHPVNLYMNAKEPVEVTRVMMTKGSGGVMRILQNRKTNTADAINEIIMDLIDKKAIKEEDGEYPPIGPQTRDNGYYAWGNNICYLVVWPIKVLDEDGEVEHNNFLKQMSEFEIPV